MTIETFLEKLAKTAEFFGSEWQTNDGSGDAIRLRTTFPYHVHCPITAVCVMETGIRYEIGSFHKAAKTLDLQGGIAVTILSAADIDGPYPRLRKKLIKAVKKPCI